MKCTVICKVLLILMVVFPLLAMAADAPPVELVEKHPQTTAWLLGLALVGLAFFIIRNMNQNEKAHEDMMRELKEGRELQWTAIDRLTRDLGIVASNLSHLQGEHDANNTNGAHRRRSTDV